jgi:pantothenate kinase
METVSWPDGRGAAQLLGRARALVDGSGGRRVLGITGAPAGGKSTLAEWLVTELRRDRPETVAHVGMDAFHLGHALLTARGQVAVKGAPHTFDALGYAALLDRIRSTRDPVFAPRFHREIEDSIAAEVEVAPAVALVVTEGNYLLHAEPPWDRIRPLLDEAWYVHLDDAERRRRLVARRLGYGQSRAEAERWAAGSDEDNARLVASTRSAADLVVEVAADA